MSVKAILVGQGNAKLPNKALTLAEYNALTQAEKNAEVIYHITDDHDGGTSVYTKTETDSLLADKSDLDNLAPVEATSTASQAYATNSFFIYNGVLYRATADIAQGGTADQIVPYEASPDLVNKINEVCGDGRAILDVFEGCTHGHPDYGTPKNEERLFAFLDSVLKK